MKLTVLKGATDQTVYVFLQNATATDGSGLTGLVYNTSSLVCYYVRPLGTATQLMLATQTVTGAHADGGFVEVSSANLPGLYRLDLSDAIVASGVNAVAVMLHGAADLAPVTLELQLVSYDPNDSVRLGLTALPNAAADAAGGLPISDAGGLDLDGRLDAAVTSRLAPTVAGRTLDVTASGNAGIDWANVENPTTALDLAATTIDGADVVGSVTGAVGSVTGDVGGNVTGSVGSVVGDVAGDVVGDVQGNVNGTVDDVVNGVAIEVGGIQATSFAVNAIDAAALATDAVDEVWDVTVETGATARQSLRLANSANAGKLSGAATTNVLIRDLADTKNRVTAVVDANGNRSTVIVDVS